MPARHADPADSSVEPRAVGHVAWSEAAWSEARARVCKHVFFL